MHLVRIADLLHQRVFDVFDANTADDAFDERSLGIHSGCSSEEGLEVCPLVEHFLEAVLVTASQSADELVDLVFRAILALRFLHIERVDCGEFRRDDEM